MDPWTRPVAGRVPNLAVHLYEEIDLDVVRSIVERELDAFEAFGAVALRVDPR